MDLHVDQIISLYKWREVLPLHLGTTALPYASKQVFEDFLHPSLSYAQQGVN